MRTLTTALVAALTLSAAPAFAQDYLAGTVGEENTTVSLGRDFGAVRGEVQYASLTDVGAFNQDARVLSVNGYLQPWTVGPVTPYLTAGVGYGQVRGMNDSDEGFVANAGAGAEWALSENWSVVGEWRTYTGDVQERIQGNRTSDFEADVTSIGVRYRF